ncbi:hypothetical protein KY343_02670 [Candidatus Woesearchaeota archaeon]|nr:hypothetical protein [Candidatus Woesearchaeota archaeon]
MIKLARKEMLEEIIRKSKLRLGIRDREAQLKGGDKIRVKTRPIYSESCYNVVEYEHTLHYGWHFGLALERLDPSLYAQSLELFHSSIGKSMQQNIQHLQTNPFHYSAIAKTRI